MAIETTTTMDSPRFSYTWDHELIDHDSAWDTLFPFDQYAIAEWAAKACEKYRRMTPLDPPKVIPPDASNGDLIHEEFPLEYILA
jgi:hypothetical protein